MDVGSVEEIIIFRARLQGYQVNLVPQAGQVLGHIPGIDAAARTIEAVLMQYANFHILGLPSSGLLPEGGFQESVFSRSQHHDGLRNKQRRWMGARKL